MGGTHRTDCGLVIVRLPKHSTLFIHCFRGHQMQTLGPGFHSNSRASIVTSLSCLFKLLVIGSSKSLAPTFGCIHVLLLNFRQA